MRILVAHPVLTGPGTVGGIKSTRALVAAFVAGGHDCNVVTVPGPGQTEGASVEALGWDRDCSYLPQAGTRPGSFTLSLVPPALVLSEAGPGPLRFGAVWGRRAIRRAFFDLVERRVREFDPQCVVWENGAANLRRALVMTGGRLLVQVKSPVALPFGPYSDLPWFRLSRKNTYARIPKIMVPSQFMRKLLHEHAGLGSCVQPNLAYGKPPFPVLGTPDGAVTMINPSAPKGISVFTGLAAAFPRQRFRAVRTWGTVAEGLSALPNVELVPGSDDMNEVLAKTKVLLVPSMWGEAFGMVCMDALLRGIPVLSSDDGGLPEASLGLGGNIPVRPRAIRSRWLRPAEVTYHEQDLGPWKAALGELLDDRGAWETRSRQARAAALRYLSGLSIEPLVGYMS